MKPCFVLTLVLLATPFAGALAQSADQPPGRVAARVFAAAPTPLAFAIEPGENSAENIALAERIAQEAAARKMRVEPGMSATILRFDTEVRSNTQSTRQTFSREGGGIADADTRTPQPPDSRDQVTDVLSSYGAGVIGARPRPSDYTLRYVVNAMLVERASGRRLWQGHVSYDTAAADRTATFVALAPVLVEQIGKSVQEQSFRLD